MENNEGIILKLDGRMANQMFQWAFARAFEAKTGILPLIDNSSETLKLNHFILMKDLKTIERPFLNKFLRKIIIFRNLRNKITKLDFNMPKYQEKHPFNDEIFSLGAPYYIQGYFQNEKYFKNIRSILIEDFKLKEKLNLENQKMLEKIKNTNSVSIHFRRGDYTKARVADVFGMCSVEYYKNAVDLIASKTNEKPTLFVFSDDIKWVRENVKFNYETFYVDINSGKKGYFDLELMKNCKHNIIANSSFSWIAAWLNQNPDKIVVAPTPWHKEIDENEDIVPLSWIKLQK